MSELNDQYVKQGYWVNEALGPVMGATITTDSRTGTIIIAILSVLASLASTHLWHLFAFLQHQLRSKNEPEDGLFRQQQALLRTLPSPSDLVADYTKLWWIWRHRARRPLLRLLPQIMMAAIFTIGTVAVSIVSTYIITSNNIEVLINSPFCANLDPFIDGGATYDNYTVAADPIIQRLSDNCYTRNSTAAECQFYIAPRIPFHVARVGCPFNSSICLPNFPAVQLDSGLQDVNAMFGLNTGRQHRIWYRKATTCAILDDVGRTTTMPTKVYPEDIRRVDFVSPDIATNEEILHLFYGPVAGHPFNSTFIYSLLEANVTATFKTGSRTYFGSKSLARWNIWAVLPEMLRNDADIVLRSVTKGGVQYMQPVNDPIFAAHKEVSGIKSRSGEIFSIFYSDFPISTLGCTQQYQFCFHTSGGGRPVCSKMSYLPGKVDELTLPVIPSPIQREIVQMFLTASALYDITSTNLVSATKKMSVGAGQSKGLPDNQWIEELINWESYAYAALQFFVVDRALGPQLRLSTPGKAVVPANTTAERALCAMQRVHKAGGFVNVNVFGLTFIITFACIVIIVDICILRFLIYLSFFRRALSPRIDQWMQDGVWQLQRRAYEAQGEGTWSRTQDEVPVTEKHEQLGVLSVDDRVVLTPRMKDELSVPDSDFLRKETTKENVVQPTT